MAETLKRTKQQTDAEALVLVCSLRLHGKPHDPLALAVTELFFIVSLLSVVLPLALFLLLANCRTLSLVNATSCNPYVNMKHNYTNT